MAEDAESRWTSPKTVVAIVVPLVAALITSGVLFSRREGNTELPHVAEATLDARVRQFYVRCPTTLAYEGSITVDRGSGTVSYRFVRRDGFGGGETPEPIRSVRVDGARTVPVRYEWTPNIPQGRLSRTVTLEVVEPTVVRSQPVNIQGECDADLPEGPDTPPPDVPGGPPG